MSEPVESATRQPTAETSGPVCLDNRGAACEANSASGGWNWKEHLGHELPKYSPIVRQSTSKPIELSFGQQRLWFVSQLDSGSAAYNVPLAWRLTGRLKIDALEWSLNQVVQRHEALRTCFPVVDGRPVQVVTEQALTLTHVDLRDAGSRLQQLIDEEIRKPFDLAQDLPVRAALFRLRDDEHLFVLTVQHISSDGASMGVLLRELSHFYDAAVGGVPPNLPEPAVQCRDFTRWQQEMLTDELREKQLAYWKQQLKDVPALLSLSSDPRTAAVSFRGGIATRQLSKELSADFKQLARRHGVTTFMALLATLDVLLYRYSGQPDIVVGASMTHRTRDEVSRSIGFFANMMALRTGLGDDPTFRDLLKRVRSVALGAYAHQDVPFDLVVGELQPERVPGRNPLFQVMLNVEEASWHDLHLDGLESAEIPVHGGTSKFDLSLSVVIRDQGFQLALEYNSDLFDAGTAQRMLGSFETLMGSAISDPGCHVSRMALLTESERSELLSRWNQTREDYPDEACVQELFEAQVQRSPDAIAVEFQGRQLSYRDLNARANQLARHLAKRGVGPEVLVGICLDPSADLLVAMLGILKAGGAYVPLDRAHPPQRRVEILTESGAQFLITHQKALREMKLPDSPVIVRMDSDWPAIAAESGENPLLTAHASNLAYVIYTSGSTGRPKGVQIEHRGVVNFLCAMQRRPGITPADVVVAITTISFDPSVLELLLPLTVGARIVIPTWEEVTDARRLLEVLERSAPTILQATPTTWQMLLAAGWQNSPQMTALCGGEPLSRGLADQLLERCASVWNIYGPTETTVWSVVHEVDRADTGPPCIGSPIANMRMYVLDSHQQPVPLGVAGELYVGGDGMARGYLGAEQLTAEKFIPDPFCAEPGARLYRSGDLVRRRPDGNLEYLARADRQMKIRGHRIEPAEVEFVIAQYPDVRRAAVVARNDGPGGTSLVAYIEPHGTPAAADLPRGMGECCSEEPAACDAELGESLVPALRRHLRQRLPDYMVPSAFVLLDHLPITVSGKLDRRALPATDSRTSDTVFVPPHDEVEARLAKLWAEALKLPAVGVTDDFFDLGGHSVLGARLLTQVEKAFGKSLPLSALFEAPTIERMAAILRHEEWSSPWLVQIQAGQSSKPPFFFVQARMGYRALAAELGPDQPVYVVPYDNSYEEQTERSFPEVAAELTAKIRELQPRGPYYLGGVCLAGWVAFSIARELYRQGEEVALLAIFDTIVPGHSAKRFQEARLGFLGEHLKWHIQNFRRGDTKQKYAYVVDSLRALRWRLNNKLWWAGHDFFRWIGRPLPRVLRQPARLTFKAALAEGPIGDYPGAVTLFRARERPQGRYDDPTAGWDKIASGGLQIYEVPGDHKHLLVPPNVSAVARQLKVCLERNQVPDLP